MYLTPNTIRLSRLTTTGYPLKSQLVFCPDCDYQLAPQTVSTNRCPDCGTSPLHVITVTPELVSLSDRA